jgi:DNA-directed RNA polymerase specialized sigma24 family protein
MGRPMNDHELVQQFARDGSAAAFRELVARHTNFVYSCACQRLHDAHAAQDVTQAVFLALALKAKGLSPSTPLPGWLYKATR